jgi:hypothetical protein
MRIRVASDHSTRSLASNPGGGELDLHGVPAGPLNIGGNRSWEMRQVPHKGNQPVFRYLRIMPEGERGKA